jgi:hypothetical protein
VNTTVGFPQGSLVRVFQPGPPLVQFWNKVHAVDDAAKRIFWTIPLDPALNIATLIDVEAPHQQDLVVQSVDTPTNQLTWTAPLGPAFDLTQTIAFSTGAAAAEGTLLDAAGNPTMKIAASSPGAWGDSLSVQVSHSNLAATATSSLPQQASGASSFVQSVVGFPVFSLVRVYQSKTLSPVIGFRQVAGVDATVNRLRWDTPLVPQFDVTKSISFEIIEFAFTVYLDRTPVESFPGLSLVLAHSRYVEKAVQSQYITATDLHSPTPLPLSLPDPGAVPLDNGALLLKGGRDGIAALQPIDFTGDAGSSTKTGVRTLEDVDEVSIVASPDILIEPAPPVTLAPLPTTPPDSCLSGTQPPPIAAPPAPPPAETAPSFSLDQILLVQQALVDHCESMQFRFAILDPPDFGFPREHVDLGEVQSWRQRFETKYAALYFPWVCVRDPLQLGGQVARRVPPSGHVAGVYANTDLTIGVHKAPANVAIAWAQGLTTELTDAMQTFLNPIGVDCLRPFNGRGLRVFGARTLSSDPSWRFVNVRRLVSMIEHALLFATQWVVFEPNDIYLRHSVRASIAGFLETIWKQGGLAGKAVDEAFFVICDDTNNSAAMIANGQLVADIGVAPTIPAEFVIFRIGSTADSLEVTE